MDYLRLHAAISPVELHEFQERLTAYGDVCFTATEARKILGELRHLHEALDRQAAITKELLRYMDRALRAETVLTKVTPFLKQDVSPEGVVLLEEIGLVLGTHDGGVR